MIQNTLLTIIIIQTLLLGLMVFMLKQFSEIIKKNKSAINHQGTQQAPLHTPLKQFPELKLNSINLNQELVSIEKNALENYLIIFISPGCSACKELIIKLLNILKVNNKNKIKPILISMHKENVEEYINLVEELKIPIVHSEEIVRKIGVRGFPTVIFTGSNLDVKDVFLGANVFRLESLFSKVA
ncbi:thioredoxin fold domain-containing protein [Virgibacillus sp. 6R]|uniref:thioredoxin fold domain-containing protein n=1 Tax=Metabacillus sp. 22489 TaxID=3453928 RepID=UPI0011A2F288